MLKVYLTRGNQGQGVWPDLPTSPAEMGEAYAVLDSIDLENLNTPPAERSLVQRPFFRFSDQAFRHREAQVYSQSVNIRAVQASVLARFESCGLLDVI